MVDRLTALDVSFLTLEDRHTPMHVGQVLVFSRPLGFETSGIAGRIASRLEANPRLRQRVRSVPGRLANPVWVDDEHFDLSYHVRRSALPSPGSTEQLTEFVARVNARLLDRSRPLWEVYVVDGLAGDRFAVVTKTHQAVIDEVTALDIAGLVLDLDEQTAVPASTRPWSPRPAPGQAQLIGQAVKDALSSPANLVGTVRNGLSDLSENGRRALGVTTTLARAWRPGPTTPLAVDPGAARRFAVVDTDLQGYREIRTRLAESGGDVDINDIALATITGALRGWMETRGQFVRSSTTMRAVVPVTVSHGAGLGASVQPVFIELPIGENSPSVRLLQVAHAMRMHLSADSLSAHRIAGLSGFSAPTLHSLGARVGGALGRRLFDLAITNVPGPQRELLCGPAVLQETYPVPPLAPGHALAIGLTSYHGRVFYGLFADRAAMPDLEVLADLIRDALAELMNSAAT
ncbi:MAG: wax ester/triacylglycerol synthase family O-acyltransferase [Dermatophilaceae bacterium]